MKIYGIFHNGHNLFFDNRNFLEKYIKDLNLNSKIYMMCYLDHIYGQNDVIEKIYQDKKELYTASLIGYYYFDEKTMKWKGSYGSLEEEYQAFRDRGIVFKNDIYQIKNTLNIDKNITTSTKYDIDEKILKKIKR